MSKTAGSTQSGYNEKSWGPVDGTIDGEYDSTVSGSGSIITSGPVVKGSYGGTATLDRAKWC